MPVLVTMRGLLEGVVLEDSFADTAQALNIAAAQGREFAATKTKDGDHILLNVNNILTIVELADEEPVY